MEARNNKNIEKLRVALEDIKKLRAALSGIGEAEGDSNGSPASCFEQTAQYIESIIVGIESNMLFLRAVKDQSILFSVKCNYSSMFEIGETIKLDSQALRKIEGCSNIYTYIKAMSV